MRFSRAAAGGSRRASIDMTPVVDTFFNLMIFFFFTATFTSEQLQPKLDINLPKSPSSTMGKAREDLAVVIRRNGDIEVEGRLVDLAALERRLVQYKREDPQGGVLIQADESVTHGKVVQVLGLVDKLQIRKLSIGVEEAR
jgi:biopolymer transport protein ExbD